LEESIAKAVRSETFPRSRLSTEQIGQLLWAAQGITEKHGGFAFRSTLPGHCIHSRPMSFYRPGIYHYNPERHELKRVKEGDRRLELQKSGA